MKHHWLTIALCDGFMTDLILLNQIDNLFDNLILLFMFVLATISMLLLYVGVSEKGTASWCAFNWSSPMITQYAFGGLLSGMLIFTAAAVIGFRALHFTPDCLRYFRQ